METLATTGLLTTPPTVAAPAVGQDRTAALSAVLDGGALTAGHPFAALLGERLAAVSPEVLRQVQHFLQTSAEGEPLPEDGNPLPPDALLALIAGLAQGRLPALTAEASGAAPARAGATPAGAAQALLGAGLTLASTASPETLLAASEEPDTSVLSPAQALVATPGTQSPAPQVLPQGAAVDVPVGRPGWGESVGQRVVWLVKQDLQAAEIQLNPRELGPVEVRIRLEGDQVHVSLGAVHGATREALEQALPRLREMFAEAGLNLASADVGRHGAGREGQAGTAGAHGGGAGQTGAESAGPEAAPPPLRIGQGLVDAYA